MLPKLHHLQASHRKCDQKQQNCEADLTLVCISSSHEIRIFNTNTYQQLMQARKYLINSTEKMKNYEEMSRIMKEQLETEKTETALSRKKLSVVMDKLIVAQRDALSLINAVDPAGINWSNLTSNTVETTMYRIDRMKDEIKLLKRLLLKRHLDTLYLRL